MTVLLTLLTSAGRPAAAAEPAGAELGAEEAVARALQSSAAGERARADAEAADSRVPAARARLLPRLGLEIGAVSTDDPVDVFALSLKQKRFSPSGFFASDPNDPSALTDVSGALQLLVPLDVAGGARASLRAARAAAEAGRRTAERTLDLVAFETISAFARARAAEESLGVLDGLLADLRSDAELSERLKAQGLVTGAEPARARAAVAEAAAERGGMEAERARARADLARLAGEDAGARPLAPLPRVAVDELAGAERPDVLAARLAADAARAAADAAAAARLPSLAGSARWEAHAPRPFGHYGDSLSVGAALRVPLFSGGGLSASLAAARAEARAAAAGAREAAERAAAEAVGARATLRAAGQRVDALEEAAEAARVARDVQRARYEQGVARLADLLDARTTEARARLGSIAARADEAVAAQALRVALGLAPRIEAHGKETRP